MHASLVDATACVDDPVAVEAPDVEDPAEELLVELDDEERHQVSPAGVPAVRRVIYMISPNIYLCSPRHHPQCNPRCHHKPNKRSC